MTLEPPADVPIEDLLAQVPRGITGLVRTVVQSRGRVALAVERGATMAELAATLAGQTRSASVTAREPDGTTWSISVGAAEHPEAPGTAEVARS
ncbi:hypothetical protein FXN61_46480 [Lentzea sp. PSKA42]|uniref:Uncharacterized protein n=1 Tax=Lentzea indica TaxID=2604800 RepID=A0ABX1FXJ7_9PSEU|nr:hypothetical protein [Lentzea indica]NKE63764.1 hypothetical protein [Lentzea indica]